MPFDGSGNYNRNFPPGGWQGDSEANIKIKSDRHDQHDNDLAAALSQMICKDGQSSPTADIPWNNKKLTSLAPPVNPADAANKAYVDNLRNFGSGITITGSPPESRIGFTTADMSWIARPEGSPATYRNRLAVNDKADGTGTDRVFIDDSGNFTTMSGQFAVNAYVDPVAVNWKSVTSGYSGVLYMSPTDGSMTFSAPASPAGAAGTVINWVEAFKVTRFGDMTARSLSCPTGTVEANVLRAGGAGSGTSGFCLYPNIQFRTLQYSPDWRLDWDSGLGTLTWIRNTVQGFVLAGAGHMRLFNPTAQKDGGGSWSDPSDERIKNVLGNYETGLEAIKALRPVRYTFRGNDTIEPPAYNRSSQDTEEELATREAPSVPYPNSPHYETARSGREFVGFVAQEAELAMPDLVTQGEAYIDGEPVTDLRNLDPSNLIFALVNAVKELAAEVEALKAR